MNNAHDEELFFAWFANAIQPTTKDQRPMKLDITKSKTADTRSCDWSQVSKKDLLVSSTQHIGDIQRGFMFFIRKMTERALMHDKSKISDIDGFHEDFKTGFKNTTWWEKHQEIERHHFNNPKYIPEDVNLIDILDQIIDGCMAAMARTGQYRQEKIEPELLQRAYQNTVKMLLEEINVVDVKDNP